MALQGCVEDDVLQQQPPAENYLNYQSRLLFLLAFFNNQNMQINNQTNGKLVFADTD